MTIRILLVALSIAWVAALAALVWMMTLAQLRPHHVLFLLIDLGFVMKACVVLSVVSAAIGIVSLRAGARPRPLIGVGGAFGWGVVGALKGVADVRSGVIAMNSPIPFAVYAQFYAEALIVLLVGLTARSSFSACSAVEGSLRSPGRQTPSTPSCTPHTPRCPHSLSSSYGERSETGGPSGARERDPVESAAVGGRRFAAVAALLGPPVSPRCARLAVG